MPHAPKTQQHAENGSNKRHPVGCAIASQPFKTLSLALVVDDRMAIVDASIYEIENVARNDWSKSHCTPVRRQAVHSKCVGDQTWVDAEQ